MCKTLFARFTLYLNIHCLYIHDNLSCSYLEQKGQVQTRAFKERGPKRKSGKNCALLTNQGGGVKKRRTKGLYFGKVFFQWAFRIILGPPKHVLHLVPSPNAIAKAFNVMLCIGPSSRINALQWFIFQKKLWVNFFA